MKCMYCPGRNIASGLPSGGIFKFLLRFLTVTEAPDRAREDDQILKIEVFCNLVRKILTKA